MEKSHDLLLSWRNHVAVAVWLMKKGEFIFFAQFWPGVWPLKLSSDTLDDDTTQRDRRMALDLWFTYDRRLRIPKTTLGSQTLHIDLPSN